MYEKQSINTGELPSLKLPKIPTLKEKSPRANLCKLWQDLKSLFKEISGGEHNEVSISQFSTVTGNGEVEVEPCWMMNWGDLFFFVKWNGTYFLKPSKPPKNTHTHKKWHDWKEWSFLSKQMYSSLFTSYVSKHRKHRKHKHQRFQRLGAGKNFPSLFFCVTFLGSEKTWSLRSGFWMMIWSGMFMMGCFFFKFSGELYWLSMGCMYIYTCMFVGFLWIFWCLWDVFISFPRSIIRFWCRWRQRTDIARQP